LEREKRHNIVCDIAALNKTVISQVIESTTTRALNQKGGANYLVFWAHEKYGLLWMGLPSARLLIG
jgi:hypothetical protein